MAQPAIDERALVLLGYVAVAFAYFGVRLLPHPGRDLVGYGRDPRDLRLVVRLVAARDRDVPEPVRQPRDLRARRDQPRLGDDRPRARGAVRARHRAVRAGGLLQPRGGAAARRSPRSRRTCSAGISPARPGPRWSAATCSASRATCSARSQGHMHMTSVFLLPLIALATTRYLQGELDGRGFAWRLGLLFGLQVWLSTELLVHRRARARPGAGPGLRPAEADAAADPRDVEAAARRDRARRRARRPVPLLRGDRVPVRLDQSPRPSSTPTCLNFLIPTHFIWIGGHWLFSISQHFRGNDSEAGSYLGIPTLVIVVWFAFGARRSAVARYLLVALAVAAILMLGTGFVVKRPRRVLASLPGDREPARSSTTSCRRGSRSTRPSQPV